MDKEIKLYLDEDFLGFTSFDYKVGLDFFCEQYGLTLDTGNDKLEIRTKSNSESVGISTHSSNELSREIVLFLKSFISSEGISVHSPEVNESSNLMLFIDVMESTPDKTPLLVIEHQSNFNEQLKNLFIVELNRANIPFMLKEINIKNPSFLSRYLNFKCYMLEENFDLEKVAMSISRAIILFNYYNHRKRTIVNYTSKAVIRNFVKSFLLDLPKTDIKHEIAVQGAPKKQEEVGSEQFPQKIKPLVETKISNSKSELPDPRVESFFDYSVLLPRSEEDELMIKAALNIKNVGTEKTTKPVICIKIPPESEALLQGQFLPPKLVSGLSMKGTDGDKGWKYVYNDWRERIRTKGEYWIEPIQELRIDPGEKLAINGLNIYSKSLNKSSSLLVQAFVYFENGKHRFSSNNSISISY